MAQNKMQLPPRKWYGLEQAAEKLTRKYNELVTISDLLHFYIIGKLELSVYVKHYPATIAIGTLIFSKFRENEEQFKKENIIFHLVTEYKNKINTDDFLLQKGANITYKTKVSETKVRNNQFDDFIYIFGFMNLYKNIGWEPNNEKELLEKGFKIDRLGNYLVFFNEEEEENSVIVQFYPNFDEDIYIPLSDLYITEKDLSNFINGKYERKKIDDIINKGGRPTPHKEAIIELAKKIYAEYPDANRESIAKAVLELVINFNYLNDQNLKLTIETMRRYLKENEIGKPKGKSILIKNLNRFK